MAPDSVEGVTCEQQPLTRAEKFAIAASLVVSAYGIVVLVVGLGGAESDVIARKGGATVVGLGWAVAVLVAVFLSTRRHFLWALSIVFMALLGTWLAEIV